MDLVFLFNLGVDYRAMGEELLYKCNSWYKQWEFINCDVQRFVVNVSLKMHVLTCSLENPIHIIITATCKNSYLPF